MADTDKTTVTTDTTGQQKDNAVKNTKDTFLDTFSNSMQQIQNAKSSMENLEKQRMEADAEEQAQQASMQGVVSVADALEMIELERKTKKGLRDAEAKYLSTAANSYANVFKAGMGVIKQDLSIGIEQIPSKLADKAGLGSTFTGVLMGAAASVFTNLKDNNETDVEEKYVGGCDTPDKAAEDVRQAVTNTKPSYDPGVGEDATEEKEVEGKDTYVEPEKTDATNISEDELSNLANLDALFKEFGIDTEEEFADFEKAVAENTLPEAYAKDVAALGGKLTVELYKQLNKNDKDDQDGKDGKENEGKDDNEIDLGY